MEVLAVNAAFWIGKRVFISGHTGFKGSWLSLCLQSVGAEVCGYATSPPTDPSLFTVAGVAENMHQHVIADIRDGVRLGEALRAARPQVVFHMAAQSLVRPSYDDPVETYSVNVMGTVHLLEAVRTCSDVQAVVNVTTDKCYENKEWLWGYRETDPLGGHDPYSNSKACSELVTSSYRNSFLASSGAAVATARAGNVIGGGDWARDRLVPDFFRAVDANAIVEIRYPESTRPWQHVLEPLSGYLQLAERLVSGDGEFSQAWNFGPGDHDVRSVRWLLDYLSNRVGGAPRWRQTEYTPRHEASLLKLDSSKAHVLLGWRPRWNLESALDMTVDWHRSWRAGEDMRNVCLSQIARHQSGNP